jgi:hypothetical protein
MMLSGSIEEGLKIAIDNDRRKSSLRLYTREMIAIRAQESLVCKTARGTN